MIQLFQVMVSYLSKYMLIPGNTAILQQQTPTEQLTQYRQTNSQMHINLFPLNSFSISYGCYQQVQTRMPQDSVEQIYQPMRATSRVMYRWVTQVGVGIK